MNSLLKKVKFIYDFLYNYLHNYVNCSMIKLIWHDYNIFGYLLFTIGGTPLLMDGRF